MCLRSLRSRGWCKRAALGSTGCPLRAGGGRESTGCPLRAGGGRWDQLVARCGRAAGGIRWELRRVLWSLLLAFGFLLSDICYVLCSLLSAPCFLLPATPWGRIASLPPLSCSELQPSCSLQLSCTSAQRDCNSRVFVTALELRRVTVELR